MSTLGESIGQNGRPNLGQGFAVQALAQIPQPAKIVRNSWAQGIIANDSPLDTPGDSGQAGSIDIDVSRDDALMQIAGVTVVEDVSPRSLRYTFPQASIDYSAELVAIDPPFVGHKSTGAFVFDNLGIAATGDIGWNAVDVAGTLIFSNGIDHTYTRLPEASTVSDISTQIIARTFATAFGRVFAGAFVNRTTGNLESLGVAWNAANGLFDDWTSQGSGAQDLIANQLAVDKVMALRSIGFQALGILNRRSLWLGYQTNNPAAPADFQIRFSGAGCVAERTAVETPLGIVFLSDDGVGLFSLNGFDIVSEAINPLIIPIDLTRLSQYCAVYNPIRNRYILTTPIGTFIWELPNKDRPIGRWLIRSLAPDNVMLFVNQSGMLSWDDVAGTWDQQTLAWSEMGVMATDAPPNVYYTSGSLLGQEDSSVATQFGEAFAGQWITPDFAQKDAVEVVTTIGYEVEYVSQVACSVTISTPTIDGQSFAGGTTRVLPNSNGKRVRTQIPCGPFESLGGRWQLRINSGNVLIYRISQLVDLLSSGPVVSQTL